MSPAVCNRVVDATRGVLNQFVSDIYIYTDHCKGAQSGKYVILSSMFVSLISIIIIIDLLTGQKVQTWNLPEGQICLCKLPDGLVLFESNDEQICQAHA